MNNLLEVKRLSVCYKNEENHIKAVRDVNFVLDAETAIGIIGESGSGKTTIGMSIMGLLDQTTEIEGDINYQNTSLLEMSEKQCNQYRWKNIAMVFQNNLNVLNPVLTIYEQIAETIIEHMELTASEVEERVNELFFQEA
jgi:peptide/nickel transport system ATP-binding protein